MDAIRSEVNPYLGRIPKPNRVELHVHLDGAIRYSTIYDLAKQKNLPLPGNGTLEDLKNACIVTQPKDLEHFLHKFTIFIPVVQGDLKAAERIAREFCEDAANHGLLYVEARYSPHNFLPPAANQYGKGSFEALREVVSAVSRGFACGYEQYGVKVRSILCSLTGTDTISDIFNLCRIFQDEQVVGMDLAGMCDKTYFEEVPLNGKERMCYEEARKCGIHRTIHAGERGSADMVLRAVELYHAERIGHGYHVFDSDSAYKLCLDRRIHFECCPYSSLLTGSVPLNTVEHPVVRHAAARANFSLSTDDPTVTGHTLEDEYELVKQWGLTNEQISQCNLNGAYSSFLPNYEKIDLLRTLASNNNYQ